MFLADQRQMFTGEYAAKKRIIGCYPIREFL
jgi:hypothetical protein